MIPGPVVTCDFQCGKDAKNILKICSFILFLWFVTFHIIKQKSLYSKTIICRNLSFMVATIWNVSTLAARPPSILKLQKTTFSLVKSRLALGSTGWLFDCLSPCRKWLNTQTNSCWLRPVQHSTPQFSLLQPTTAQFSLVKTSKVQYSPVQPSTAQYSPVKPSKAQ